MAIEEGILIKIGADVNGAIKSIVNLEKELKNFEKAAKNAGNVTDLSNFNKKVDETKTKLEALKSFKGINPQFASGANQAANSLQNLGRIAQDAPFGFIGIQNNINPLIESFQRLKVETGSTKGALSALVGSLSGAAGIGLAVSVATGLLTVLASSGFFKTKKAADEAKTANDEFRKSLLDVEASATTTGFKLQKFVDIARDGNRPLSERNAALKEANGIMGEHGEKLTLLNISTAAVTTQIQKFTQATIQQAIANKFADRAADVFISLNEAQKKYLDVSTNLTQQNVKLKSGLVQAGQGAQGMSEQIQRNNEALDEALNPVKSGQRELNELKKGFETAQTAATGFFGAIGTKDKTKEKSVKDIKTFADVIKELRQELATTANLQAIEKITPTLADEERLKAYSKALKDLFDLGANANTKSVVDIIAELNPVEVRVNRAKASELFRNLKIEDFPLDIPIEPIPIVGKTLDNSSFDKFGEAVRFALLAKLKGRDSVKGAQGITVPIGLANNEELKSELDEDAIKLQNLVAIGEQLSGVFEGVFTSLIEGGGNALKIVGNFIKQLIAKLLAAAAVAAILAAFTGGFSGAATAGGTNFLSRFKGKTPFFAEGGIVSKPTLAMIGEGGESEAVIPMSKLNQLIGSNNNNNNAGGILETRISGDDLVILLNRANTRRGRSYGG